MTTETIPEHTSVQLSYAGPSTVVAEDGVTRVNLAANLQRDPVRVAGKVRFRLHDIRSGVLNRRKLDLGVDGVFGSGV